MERTTNGAGRALSPDETREQYLGLLLRRFEGGGLDAYEYARRVRALELATSAAAMADIVDAPQVTEHKLDPVDMVLLARSSSAPAARDRRKSYVWLVIVAVFFVALMVVGMWLVSHAKSLQNSGNLGLRTPPAAATVR